MKSAHFLRQRGSHYYFRVRVPADLAAFFSRSHIEKSLRTRNPHVALTAARILAGDAERRFARLRTSMLTYSDIRNMVKEWFFHLLDDSESELYSERGPIPFTDIRKVPPQTFRQLIDENRQHLANDRLSEASIQANLFLFRMNLTEQIEVNSETYKVLCREILKARIELFTVLNQRQQGNYLNPVDSLVLSGRTPLSPPAATSAPAPEAPPDSRTVTPKISSLAEAFSDAHSNWARRTRTENLAAITQLQESLGDIPIGEITHRNLLDFRQALSKLPPRRKLMPEYKDKTFQELIESDHPKTLDTTTINNILR